MAHDIAQETWIALSTQYADKNDTEIVKLSHKISQYIYWAMKEKAGREVTPPENWTPASKTASPERQALMGQVRSAFKQLTGRCAEVMTLLLEGYRAPEIKVKMGAPTVGAVHVWIFRCTEDLREKLGAGGRK
jgi:DNA-directed RNA polymerase specialized sigma24 family protein